MIANGQDSFNELIQFVYIEMVNGVES